MMLQPGKTLNPKMFGLSPRLDIRQMNDGSIVLIKDRKSRIIMKDGRQVVSQMKAIRKVFPDKKVTFFTTTPVCSKTKNFLKENGITLSTP